MTTSLRGRVTDTDRASVSGPAIVQQAAEHWDLLARRRVMAALRR